jgi:hypothetical protein
MGPSRKFTITSRAGPRLGMVSEGADGQEREHAALIVAIGGRGQADDSHRLCASGLLDGARLVRKEDGDVPASEGYSLAQIMPQHHIQSIVPQRPGNLLCRGRIITVAPQSPFNRR